MPTPRSLSNSLIRKMRYQKKLQKLAKVQCRSMNVNERLWRWKAPLTPGTDGLTAEFYHYFWNAVKKNKNTEYLTNWRPVSLLNVDYKIATKSIALRLEKILPSIIRPCQSGYVKGRFIGESIRLIADTMDLTKIKNIPGMAVFLDFEKAFDSIGWDLHPKMP